MLTTVFEAVVSVVRFVVLGPIVLLPLSLWRRISARGGANLLFALPGAMAMGLWLLGLGARWPVATIGPQAAAGLRRFSPIHRLCDQLLQLAVLAGSNRPPVAIESAIVAWICVAFLTTVLLAPLYLVVVRRRSIWRVLNSHS